METSKTKELTPNLMRTFSVLLDQIVDVMCPCTRADTLDAAPAANALDCAPSGRERLESRQWVPSVPEASTLIISRGEDKPIGNSILRAGVLSRLHHVRSDQRRCRGNERHSLGVSRVATFIVAHRLSPSFGSATTRRSSPGGARAAAQQLIDQRTFARTRHQPSCQKRTWSSRPPKESPPVRIRTAWPASAAVHEKTFLRHQLLHPIPLMTCRVCQLA